MVSGSQPWVLRPSTGAGLSTKSVLLAMVSVIVMISRMLITCWDIRIPEISWLFDDPGFVVSRFQMHMEQISSKQISWICLIVSCAKEIERKQWTYMTSWSWCHVTLWGLCHVILKFLIGLFEIFNDLIFTLDGISMFEAIFLQLKIYPPYLETYPSHYFRNTSTIIFRNILATYKFSVY